MTDTIVIIALLVYIGWKEYQTGKERKDLLRLLKAKDLDEVSRAELIDKAKPEKDEKRDPDLMPVEEQSEDQFDKMIEEQLK